MHSLTCLKLICPSMIKNLCNYIISFQSCAKNMHSAVSCLWIQTQVSPETTHLQLQICKPETFNKIVLWFTTSDVLL